MSARHFHFALEFSAEALSNAVRRDVVKSVLRHAGLSAADADRTTAEVLEAAEQLEGLCRVEFEGGVDEVAVVVSHAGKPTWRGRRLVE